MSYFDTNYSSLYFFHSHARSQSQNVKYKRNIRPAQVPTFNFKPPPPPPLTSETIGDYKFALCHSVCYSVSHSVCHSVTYVGRTRQVVPCSKKSVYPSANFNFAYSFLPQEMAFIFGMCVPYDQTFPMVPKTVNT